MIEAAQIGFWEVCWAFYKSIEILAARFPTLQFFASWSRELCDNLQALGFFPQRPARFRNIPRSTRELSVKLLALGIFPRDPASYPRALFDIPARCIHTWDSSKSIQSSFIVLDVSYKSLLAWACMNILETFPNAWKISSNACDW